MLGKPCSCLGERVCYSGSATDRNIRFAQDEVFECLQVFAQLGRIVFRHKIPFSRPRQRETLLISSECCALRRDMISLFYKWGEAAEVNP